MGWRSINQNKYNNFFELKYSWISINTKPYGNTNIKFSIVMYTFIRLLTYSPTHTHWHKHSFSTNDPLLLRLISCLKRDAWLIAVLLVDRWLPIYYLLHQGQPVLRYFSRFLIIAGSDIPLRDTTPQQYKCRHLFLNIYLKANILPFKIMYIDEGNVFRRNMNVQKNYMLENFQNTQQIKIFNRLKV